MNLDDNKIKDTNQDDDIKELCFEDFIEINSNFLDALKHILDALDDENSKNNIKTEEK